MMAARYYKPDHRSIAAFLLSRQLNKPVRQVAALIQASAVAKTPRQSESERRRQGATDKHIADSYERKTTVAAGPPDGNHRWGGGKRLVELITNSAEGAVQLEFGTSHMQGRHMLRDAGLPFHTPIPADEA